ncbi:transposase [Bradyrhizobium algeriense]|uniref:transposase n=1 Tax=Bradyrhizobium algeriense TaxID=634784 RepID=UPI0011AE329F|nr:transposase [Bradyrhizobium algeriense]
MIALRSDLKVVLAAQPVDFRKSLHTLSALVSEALRANPWTRVSPKPVKQPAVVG